MLLKSDAYEACIGFFSDNLHIFEGHSKTANGTPISDVVTDQVADMLIAFCSQQTQLSNDVRLSVIAEGDQLVDDIEQILGMHWHHDATAEQKEFIEEYFLLLKNSLDSQVEKI
jgi:hypothetical protein